LFSWVIVRPGVVIPDRMTNEQMPSAFLEQHVNLHQLAICRIGANPP
jgi:hypothetical protein